MSRAKELLKNTGILMIARISTQLVSFLLLPLYTTLLSTAEYGEIDIYTSLTMIVIPFLTLQLEMGLFRFFITEKSENSRKKIVSTTFIVIVAVLLFASIVFWAINIVLKIQYAMYIYWFYLSMTLSTVLLQVCRAYGNNKVYGFASFLSSALAVCLNVFFIAGLGWKVEAILLSSTIAQLVSSVYIIIRTKVFSYFSPRCYDKNVASKLLKYSVPLVFNQISSWAINYSDRLIILHFWGTSSNGIYSLSNKFSNITNTFFNVFNVAWTENVVRCMDDNDSQKYINSMFMIIFNVYLALITGIINLLPFFWKFMVNTNYSGAYGHVPILLLAMFFSGMAATIGSVYIAYSKTREVSITTIMAGICNVTIHFFLLHKCGLYAASISTLVSFGILFFYRYVFVKKFFMLEIEWKKAILQMVIFVVAWIAYLWKTSGFIVVGLLLNLSFIFYVFLKNRTLLLKMIRRE